jgi:hypothetical protein
MPVASALAVVMGRVLMAGQHAGRLASAVLRQIGRAVAFGRPAAKS